MNVLNDVNTLTDQNCIQYNLSCPPCLLPLLLFFLSVFSFSPVTLDIGGLDKQIQELIEAVVLPMTKSELFESIGIRVRNALLVVNMNFHICKDYSINHSTYFNIFFTYAMPSMMSINEPTFVFFLKPDFFTSLTSRNNLVFLSRTHLMLNHSEALQQMYKIDSSINFLLTSSPMLWPFCNFLCYRVRIISKHTLFTASSMSLLPYFTMYRHLKECYFTVHPVQGRPF